MTIQTATQKNNLVTEYFNGKYGALSTTAPSGTAGTEVSGGSPAYARKSLAGVSPSGGVGTVTVTFDVPISTTVVGAEVFSAVTSGTYLDGCGITSQTFAAQGTYAVSFTYTQT